MNWGVEQSTINLFLATSDSPATLMRHSASAAACIPISRCTTEIVIKNEGFNGLSGIGTLDFYNADFKRTRDVVQLDKFQELLMAHGYTDLHPPPLSPT
jgi:hypothetical protein